MKKSFFILAISSLFLISCAEKKTKSEKDTTHTPKIEEVDLNTDQIDSLTNKIEKTKEDIDDAAKDLDNLLEEL